MPRIEYERLDTRLVIEPGEGDLVRLELRREDDVLLWTGETDPNSLAPPDLLSLLSLLPITPKVLWGRIRRLVLDVRRPELSGHPWEKWLGIATGPTRPFDTIVRVSSVRARVSQATFTVPLRVLLCDPPNPEPLQAQIRAVFGERSSERDARVALAFESAACSARDLMEPRSIPRNWPVVDILHLLNFPLAKVTQFDLSPNSEDFGSVGWLAQRLNAWQTRLLIVDAPPESTWRARQFASSLIDRGGPAVLVRLAGEPIPPLYDRLIHDMALDALNSASHQHTGSPSPKIDSLFLGGGREELTRVSAAAEAMLRESEAVVLRDLGNARAHDTLIGLPSDLADRFALHPSGRIALGRAASDYANWSYNISEFGGLIPMAESLNKIRVAMGHYLGSDVRLADDSPRHVNGSLWLEDKDKLNRVDAGSEILRVGSPYQFSVQIGPRDRAIPVYESSAFQEIPRVAGKRGVWIEVAVNGVGFDVRGAPVQELWLPFDEPTDRLWFSVVPTRPGAAMLRYTIYYRQNVVQSFRLGALTSSAAKPMRAEQRPRGALARAMHLPLDKLPAGTYVTRLEYEAVPIERADSLQERRVSLVVNATGAGRVITVKGKRYFFDCKPGVVDQRVSAAREVFFKGAVDKDGKEQPADWISRFGINEGINRKNLDELLPAMALAGWQMYDKVFSSDDRGKLLADLSEVDGKIDVAHTLLDDVVPWALMYDRRFTNKPAPGSRIATCTVALPDAEGALTAHDCGEAPACLLNHGISPENVACPLHFWGFRHQIEIPAKQAKTAANEEEESNEDNTQEAIASDSDFGTPAGQSSPPRLSAVLNSGLASATSHGDRLKAIRALNGRIWTPLETDATRVLQAMSDANLSVLYLFCHARGGIHDPEKIDPPVVEFGGAESVLRYSPDEIQARWKDEPLVIINGCDTAALTPDALSPFVLKFSRDCKAGAVIGTEIPLHELVAANVAERLLEHILAGEPVGSAVLRVRRELLAIGNPLGLAYTLYGTMEHVVRQA